MWVKFKNFSKIQNAKIYTPPKPIMPKKLLVHFDGANNSSTFTDVFGHTSIPHGSPKISTTQSMFGGSSLKLSSSNFLQYQTGNDFKFSGDFTVEFFLYLTGTTVGIFDNRSSSGTGFYLTRDTNKIAIYTGSWNYGNTINLNQWYHVAVSRRTSSLKVFINGSINISINNSTNFTSGGCYIGGLYNSSINGTTGYIDELQIINGYGKYTTNFSNPSQPFPIIEYIPS